MDLSSDVDLGTLDALIVSAVQRYNQACRLRDEIPSPVGHSSHRDAALQKSRLDKLIAFRNAFSASQNPPPHD